MFEDTVFLFIYSTIYHGTPNDVLRQPGWATLLWINVFASDMLSKVKLIFPHYHSSNNIHMNNSLCSTLNPLFCKECLGRAMAQAASRRPLIAEALVRSRFSPCGICGGQSGIGTGFSPSTSVFPCRFHSTSAPLLGKMKKFIIFITGLHDKP